MAAADAMAGDNGQLDPLNPMDPGTDFAPDWAMDADPSDDASGDPSDDDTSQERPPLRLDQADLEPMGDLNLNVPDPDDDRIHDADFRHQIELAWQVCDRFDLQTEIWRGRILRAIRDREKKRGDGRGTGFLNWLKDREISKSQAYKLIELADSADVLLARNDLSPTAMNRFSKQAFVETAKAPVEVQHLVVDVASGGDRVRRQTVRQLSDEWAAMTSDLLPENIRAKAADHTLPPRYLAPLVRELEKLPEVHQSALRDEVEETPDTDTVKQATAQARYLAKYLDAATQVRALDPSGGPLDLELALEEALRIGALNVAADLVAQATQLEQAITKVYGSWKRIRDLADRLYVESGSSTPHLRHLISQLQRLSGDQVEVPLAGGGDRTIRVQILELLENDPDADPTPEPPNQPPSTANLSPF